MPSLKPYWLETYLKYYTENENLLLLKISKSGNPYLLAAFRKTEKHSLTLLCEETSDFNDLIYLNLSDSVLNELLIYLETIKIQNIYLTKIPSKSKTLKKLESAANKLGWSYSQKINNKLPYVSISKLNPIIKWKGIDKNKVNKYENRYIELSKKHSVELKLVKTVKELDLVLDTIYELHRRRWKIKGIKSKFNYVNRRKFTREICLGAIKDKTLFLPLLYIDGQIAAYVLGFRYNKTIYAWNQSFSLSYNKYSPGSILTCLILKNADSYNFSEYNFMRGDEQWKFIWTKSYDKIYEINLTKLK